MRTIRREELVGDESEAHFQQRIQRRARLLGWDDFHVHDPIGMRKGWPDLALLRDEVLILAELKSEHGYVTPQQRLFLEKARRIAVVEAYLWKPRDEQEIWRILERNPAGVS